MSKTDIRQQATKEWAIRLYYLTIIYFLCFAFLIYQSYFPTIKVIDIIVVFLLADFASKKSSRGCDIALIVIVASHTNYQYQVISGGFAKLSEIFEYGRESQWAFIVFSFVYLLVAMGHMISAIRYHHAARTRIDWYNAVLNGLIVLVYFAILFVLVAIVGTFHLSFLPAKNIAYLLICGTLLLLIFAVWRKLPGIRSHPVVIGPDSEVGAIKSDISAEDNEKLLIAASVAGMTDDGVYIVSPLGIFGKFYCLTKEQFDSYLERQRLAAKNASEPKHSRPIEFFFLLFMILVLGVWLDTNGTIPSLPFALIILAGLWALRLWRMQRKFRNEFPNALSARSSVDRWDKFLFGKGANEVRIVEGMIAMFMLFLFSTVMAKMPLTAGFSGWIVFVFISAAIYGFLTPVLAKIGRWKFRRRYGQPLTPDTLLAARMGQIAKISD